MNTPAHTFAARRNRFGAAFASVLVTTTLLASVVGGFGQKAYQADQADQIARAAQAAQRASAQGVRAAVVLAAAQPTASAHPGL